MFGDGCDMVGKKVASTMRRRLRDINAVQAGKAAQRGVERQALKSGLAACNCTMGQTLARLYCFPCEGPSNRRKNTIDSMILSPRSE